jgi:ribosomal protein S18 acetylase RimI-like enzyme
MNTMPLSLCEGGVDVANASNFIDFFTTLADVPGAATETTDGFVRVTGPVPHPFFNLIHSFDTHACSGNLAGAVDRALAPFRARRCPIMWIVFPAIEPDSDRLMACLTAARLRLFADYRAMAVDLAAVAAGWTPSGDLSIERVADVDTMRAWVDVQAACDGGAHERIKGVRVRYASLRGFDQDDRQQTYLARYKGKPVGCSILHLAAGVAGVYQVATLPGVRRRGFGRAMTMYALLEGRARGCDFGVLHATPTGEGLYRSIGFVDRPPVKLFLDLAAQS